MITPQKIESTHSAWPHYSEDEVLAVSDILRSGKVNYWTGEQGRLFEQEYASALGVEYGVALMNGTVALQGALFALGVGPGDEVVTTSRTFIATASAVVLCGAKVIFADVDENTQNITAASIEAVLTPRTKVIIAVHLAGWPCAMDEIMALAKKHNLKVVEDCAQAHGAIYKGKPVGAWGDIAAFSFCQDKIITTGGEGGLIVTNSAEIWQKIWSLKDHGKSYDTVYKKEHPPGFRWLHESFGTNWRMTELQAVIGRLQLKKLPEWIRIRRQNADILNQAFVKIPALRVTLPPQDVIHAYYKYYVFLKEEKLSKGWSRDRLLQAITENNIFVQTGTCSEIYLEQAFKFTDMRLTERLPVAKKLGETSLLFCVHPTLNIEDMHRVANKVAEIVKQASCN